MQFVTYIHETSNKKLRDSKLKPALKGLVYRSLLLQISWFLRNSVGLLNIFRFSLHLRRIRDRGYSAGQTAVNCEIAAWGLFLPRAKASCML